MKDLCYCAPRLTLLIAQEQAVLLAAWFQVRTSMIIIIMSFFFTNHYGEHDTMYNYIM